ncbi:MAG: UDP-N-acetylmuramate--L-alanine ligase [Clostridia bacterium]|nr:UDP-N-acetylmuramate--L-alanine ligase [Clostridia bacterium]
MNIYNLNNGAKIHFIGIGGVSMSSLAIILKKNGYLVSGSDVKRTNLTDKLESNDIRIYYTQKSSNIQSPDLVVYTAAISHDNEEYIAAINSGAKVVERCELLGELMKKYKDVCCITGTHGKTTTSSMVSLIMIDANLDPTALIGAEVKELNGNYRIGKNDVMVAEACEYVESFLKFFPTKAVILNVDEDHLDYYKNIDHIISAFRKFANLIDENGTIVVNADDSNSLKALNETKANIIKYGMSKNNTYYPENIVYNEKGCASYDLMSCGKKLTEIVLNVPGKHNVSNSLAAAAIALDQGCSYASIASGLSKFYGAERRFEYKGKFEESIIIDDYAHHPTEIKATLDTAENISHKSIIAIFQPHTYTRTKALLNDFSNAFYKADKVIITDIYAAREKDDGTIHANDLVNALKINGVDAEYIPDFDDICQYIKKNSAPGNIFITIGAGDIYKISNQIANS